MIKPKRVLCKRGYELGNDFQYIEGQWYDVVYNENDTDETFSIKNHQGHTELFFMYQSDDENLPRTYKKWFYSIEQIREMKLKQLEII